MLEAARVLDEFEIPYEVEIISAHRTPDRLFAFASMAAERGIEVIIAGAGGAAHLPGMTAAKTLVPVIGVPIESKYLRGIDSLLSIVQMPKGVPVATVAIGTPGAQNAAILAAQILAVHDIKIRNRLTRFREEQAEHVLKNGDPRRSGTESE